MSDRVKLPDPKSNAEAERLTADPGSVPGKSAPSKNKIGARMHGSLMAISTAPSINYTPIGPCMVPIAYPTVQDLTNSIGTAKTGNFNGCPAYLLDGSTQTSCRGDAAGTGKGVRSGTVSGEVKPTQGSKTVRIEGKRVVRAGDSCTMNGGNNLGVYVTTCVATTPPSRSDAISSAAQTWDHANPLRLSSLSGTDKFSLLAQKETLAISALKHAIYTFNNAPQAMLVASDIRSKETDLLRVRNSLSIALLSVFGGIGAAARLSGQTEEQVAAANDAGASLLGIATSLSGMPARSAGSLAPRVPASSTGVKILPRTLFVPTPPQRVLTARARQEKMLKDDIGYNISPTSWDAFPSIGRNGTFISDSEGILGYFKNHPLNGKTAITKDLATKIEADTGLEPGTLHAGFKIRKITSITNANPRSPLEGNKYFLGKGEHLPGGAPEVVIDSIPQKTVSLSKPF